MSTNETLDLLKQALASGGDLAKSGAGTGWTQPGSATTGLQTYDLEAPAKSLYPVITPLRNIIPRVSGNGSVQANWRAITGINVNNLSAGVGEGNRGGIVTTSTRDYLAAYRGIGLEDSVTFEAQYAGAGFEDIRARASQQLLRALMIQEEKVILFGNQSVQLGTTPTPTVSNAASGGTIAAATYNVIVVALTPEAYLNSTVSAGIPTGQISRTNADGSTETYGGGTAAKSAAASTTPSGSTSTISASVTAVRGAAGYAWFVGTSGAEKLQAITSINSVLLTSLATTHQAASAVSGTDYSTNGLVFNGLMSMVYDTSNGAYYSAQATGTAGTGTPLTAGTDGTIAEFDTALQYFWDNLRLSPSAIWVSSQEMNYIRKKILTGSSAAAQRFTFQSNQNGLMGGTIVRGYQNPFTMSPTGEELPIKMHPNMPAGTIMFTTDSVPYPLSNVGNIMQIRTRQEYYQIEFPLRSRKYELGVYADEVLQHYFPPSMGIITNIAAG